MDDYIKRDEYHKIVVGGLTWYALSHVECCV